MVWKRSIATKPQQTDPQIYFRATLIRQELDDERHGGLGSRWRSRQTGLQEWSAMFSAGSCYACHRIAGEGGAVGPDLTSVGGKFGAYDLLESIVDPGKEISDQYGSSVFTTTDGTQLNGRIMNMRNNEYWVNTDMMKPSTVTKVKAENLASIEPLPFP